MMIAMVMAHIPVVNMTMMIAMVTLIIAHKPMMIVRCPYPCDCHGFDDGCLYPNDTAHTVDDFYDGGNDEDHTKIMRQHVEYPND